MNDLAASLLLQIAGPLLIAAAGWLVTKLPGPLRDWLASSTHQRDVALLVGAMTRKAQASLAPGAPAEGTSPQEVVRYAVGALPETVRKLRPTDDALATMAAAAITSALSAAGGRPVALPPDAAR